MEKKKLEDFLLKHKEKLMAIIIALLVLTGFLLIFINVKGNSPTQKIDPRANIYSDDNFESEQKTSKSSKDSCNHCHRDVDYSYCKYSDYNCDHDDYNCYFDRKRKCDEENSEDESKILYILHEKDEDRYLIADYKYGYTYRSSPEYIKKHGDKIIIEYKTTNTDDSDDYTDFEKGDSGEYYYYRYNSFTKEDEKIMCYKIAPADKLFYTKCPEF